MDQDAKPRVSISKYTHKLTNKPSAVAATRLKWFEKEKITIENKSETYNHRRCVAFGPLIGLIWVFCRM